jgi:hypothetical protein
MTKTMIRILSVCAIGACFMGLAGSAMAQKRGMRGLRAEMARLQTAQSAARSHHNRPQVHYLQGLIDRLQFRMDHHG